MIVSLYIYVEKVGNYFPLVVEEPKGGGGGVLEKTSNI